MLAPAFAAPPAPLPPQGADAEAALRADVAQVRSLCEFVESLVRELQVTEGTPDKALMRELLSKGLRKGLDLAGSDACRHFVDSLAANIHKFPLQEQQSLARIWPVEISSEYANLQSFVLQDQGVDDLDGAFAIRFDAEGRPILAGAAAPPREASGPAPSLGSALSPASAQLQPGGGTATADVPPDRAPGQGQHASVFDELRASLRAIPARPNGGGTGLGAEDVLARLGDDDVADALLVAEPRIKSSFFSDLRLNLFKFTESTQQNLVEDFPELRVEVARLVDSMTQEVARWLDEEQAARLYPESVGPLLGKLRAMFQAILSAPFLATFKHLGGADMKRGKESFLLKVALCLRACAEKRFTTGGDVDEFASRLRRQFFYVEGYGELMEDWLQSRLSQLNDEFFQRVVAATSSTPAAVLARIRRTFRPGRWRSFQDPQLEDDIYALFLDESFPRHVLTNESIIRMLKKIPCTCGGADFQIYGTIARLPLQRQTYTGLPPIDAAEAALIELLQRFPPFPALKRLRPGLYLFGRVEVEFVLKGPALWARTLNGGVAGPELTADEFFYSSGPTEHPTAAEVAAQASRQLVHGTLASTRIEAHALALPGRGACFGAQAPMGGLGGLAPLPMDPRQLQPQPSSVVNFAQLQGIVDSAAAARPNIGAGARYEPYPNGAIGATAPKETASALCKAFGMEALGMGLEDEEI